MLKKPVQFFLLLFAPVILFHSAIELVLDRTVVKYLFKGFETSLSADICVLALAAIIIYYYLTRPKEYISSKYRNSFVISVALIYLLYRFLWHHWIFFHFQLLSFANYADLILLVALGEIYLLSQSYVSKTKVQKSESAFYGNQPISTADDDKLGYPDYAAVIAEKLNQSKFDEAFAIGINGKWGSGKTSFLNLVRENIRQDRRIIIDFKPWNAHDPQAIMKDFFETVQIAISPYHATLASEIREYGKKLVELHSNSIFQSLSAIFDILTGYNDSLSNQYKQINEGLKQIDHQLIICIDDLDRLDTSEISEVIRLIRNTANFYNTVFLAAYDREYLLSAIKQLNEYNYQHFLEKIFQLEINLPGFNMSLLKNYLNEEIIKVFGVDHEAECKAAVDELYTYQVNVLKDWIASIRDVNHILNSLIVNAVQIKEEILISDMLKLEMLRYRYPSIYNDLFYRSEDWLNSDQASTYREEPTYHLRNGSQHQLVILGDLTDAKGAYQLHKDEADKIVNLLNLLFKQNYGRTGQEYLALKYPLNFSKYFHYSLKKSQLSNKEFYAARRSDLATFKKKITEWLNEDYAIQLHRTFQRLDDFTDREDFEKVIKAIIFMSNTRLPEVPNSFFRFYAFRLPNFADSLHDYNFTISKKYYNDLEGREGKFKSFVRSLFDEAIYPYYYEAQVLSYFKKGDVIAYSPLTFDEIDGYLIKYFKDYLSKTVNFSYDDWRFFDYLRKDGQQNHIVPPTKDTHAREAIELFKAHAEKYLNDFLALMINPEMGKKDDYSVSKYAWYLFPGTELADLLEKHKGDFTYVPEFVRFMEAYEKNKRIPVSFDFKTIPVRKREYED
jgi:hypothetical protein